MPALGVTGGVGTGKSSLTVLLQPLLAAKVFDSDRLARELLDSDPDVHQELKATFGREVFTEDSRPDRTVLRNIVFEDADARRSLEAILHPRIREAWLSMRNEQMEKEKGGWLIVDIPLLYETGAEAFLDRVAVVACGESNQLGRLVKNRGLPSDIAMKMIRAQLPLSQKIAKADHLIWNDSTPVHMEEQAKALAALLKSRYG